MRVLHRIVLASVLFGFVSFSAIAEEAVDPKLVKEVMDGLRPLLIPHVRTLTRPVMLYHWANRSSVPLPLTGAVNAEDPAFKSYVERIGKSYFRYAPKSSDTFGPGFYLATDPVSTRSFGARGPTWVLLEMQMAEGTRFLNGQAAFDLSFPPALVQNLKLLGCFASQVKHIFLFANPINRSYYSPPTPADPKSAPETITGVPCQKLREAIATDPELRIQAIRYSYFSINYTGCGARENAFLTWDAKPFLFSESHGFTASYDASDSSLGARARINALFHLKTTDGIEAGSVEKRGFSVPFPELEGRTSPKEALTFIKKYFIGCDPKYREDDAYPTD